MDARKEGASRPSPPPFERRVGRSRDLRLVDLHDDLLLLILSCLDPLPDLFNVRRTCRRLAELGRAQELTVLVVGEDDEGGEATTARGRFRARECHALLSDAVAAARPGDTIRVSSERGKRHRIESSVRVTVPVSIEGCGLRPDETVVVARLSSEPPRPFLSSCCPAANEETAVATFRGDPEAALSFSASAAVLRNLSVVVAPSPSAAAAAAVLHAGGRLAVERCSLVGGGSACGSLAHLVAPVVTTAVGGTLRVEETRISRVGVGGPFGGGAAIRAVGTGALSSVRSVPLSRGGALLWAEVDAERGRGKVAGSDRGCDDVSRCSFVDAFPTAAEVRVAAAAAATAAAP